MWSPCGPTKVNNQKLSHNSEHHFFQAKATLLYKYIVYVCPSQYPPPVCVSLLGDTVGASHHVSNETWAALLPFIGVKYRSPGLEGFWSLFDPRKVYLHFSSYPGILSVLSRAHPLRRKFTPLHWIYRLKRLIDIILVYFEEIKSNPTCHSHSCWNVG